MTWKIRKFFAKKSAKSFRSQNSLDMEPAVYLPARKGGRHLMDMDDIRPNLTYPNLTYSPFKQICQYFWFLKGCRGSPDFFRIFENFHKKFAEGVGHPVHVLEVASTFRAGR